jgi:hypothetical protein
MLPFSLFAKKTSSLLLFQATTIKRQDLLNETG